MNGSVKVFIKIIKIVLLLLVVLVSSYAGLWYGFAKGYEHAQKESVLDAIFTVSNLKNLRDGKADEVIDLLEIEVDTAIIFYSLSGNDITKYLIGITSSDPETYERSINFIKEYRKSTSYNCEVSEDVCAMINDTLMDSE